MLRVYFSTTTTYRYHILVYDSTLRDHASSNKNDSTFSVHFLYWLKSVLVATKSKSLLHYTSPSDYSPLTSPYHLISHQSKIPVVRVLSTNLIGNLEEMTLTLILSNLSFFTLDNKNVLISKNIHLNTTRWRQKIGF